MSYHVLVIGDTDLDSKSFSRIFSDACDQLPVFITQGTAGVSDFLMDYKADAIFIRIDMPTTNGLEITRSIRKGFPEINLVWMAYSGGYAMAAFEEGVDAFLELPMTREKLPAVLKRLERRSSA